MVPNAGKCCLHHSTEKVGFCNAGKHLSPVPDQKLKGSLHIVESANKSLQRPQRDPTFGDARHQDDVGQNNAKLQVRIPQWRWHVFKLDYSYRKIEQAWNSESLLDTSFKYVANLIRGLLSPQRHHAKPVNSKLLFPRLGSQGVSGCLRMFSGQVAWQHQNTWNWSKAESNCHELPEIGLSQHPVLHVAGRLHHIPAPPGWKLNSAQRRKVESETIYDGQLLRCLNLPQRASTCLKRIGTTCTTCSQQLVKAVAVCSCLQLSAAVCSCLHISVSTHQVLAEGSFHQLILKFEPRKSNADERQAHSAEQGPDNGSFHLTMVVKTQRLDAWA